MPDRLHFTASDEGNALIASDPMALLVGFALDQLAGTSIRANRFASRGRSLAEGCGAGLAGPLL